MPLGFCGIKGNGEKKGRKGAEFPAQSSGKACVPHQINPCGEHWYWNPDTTGRCTEKADNPECKTIPAMNVTFEEKNCEHLISSGGKMT
jgi:hypothetical protein